MLTASREQMTLFVERAREIVSFSFAQEIRQKGALSIRISTKAGESLRIEYTEPSREAYAAFILVLRSFIDNRDGISLFSLRTNDIVPGSMAELLNDGGVSDQWKAAYSAIRDDVVVSLQEMPQHLEIPDMPTRKVLLETFVYGDFAHLNSDKRLRLQGWRAKDLIYTLYKQEFAGILVQLLNAIQHMLHYSEQELNAAT